MHGDVPTGRSQPQRDRAADAAGGAGDEGGAGYRIGAALRHQDTVTVCAAASTRGARAGGQKAAMSNASAQAPAGRNWFVMNMA